MDGAINIDNLTFSFEQLAKGTNLSHSQHLESSILQFIEDWQNNEDSFELNTSGSTGKPKAILISRNQVIASAKSTLQTLGISEGDKALLCINPNYIGGKMMIARSMIGKLNLTIVTPSLDPSEQMNEVQKFDFVALVPAQLRVLMDSKRG